MADATERDKLQKRLGKKKAPPEINQEIVNGIFPVDRREPLRPVTGDTGAALKLIYSFGFSGSRNKIENLWQLLWGMTTEQYYEPPGPTPPLSPSEEAYPFPRVLPPYPDRCYAHTTGFQGSRDDRCRGDGEPPLYPKTHQVMNIRHSGVWICWNCYSRQSDLGDTRVMEEFHRGDSEILVMVRDPFRTERLSSLHGR